MIQSLPERSALALRFPASEPLSGSVRAKQPSFVPDAMPGSHSCFCSSVPYDRTLLPNKPMETETMPRTAESARPSSSMPMQYVM
jgi:hypothetical protein